MPAKCSICERKLAKAHLRGCSLSKITNAILVGSLYAFGCASASSAQSAYQKCCLKGKLVCHRHFVQSAQCMCTEMALMGKRYTPFEGSSIGAYVTLLDVPAHIVDLLNANGKNIGVDVEIGTRDVWKFLNDVLRRYYGTPLWLRPGQGEMEANPEEEVPQEVDQKYSVEELLQGGSTATANQEEHDIKEVIYDIFEDDEESVASVESNGSEYKPEGESDSEYEPEEESDPESDEFSLTSDYKFASCTKETDATALQHNYLVEGEVLMELFRFCPNCGTKLDKAQLTAVNTVAVVKYACNICEPCTEVKQWESQKLTVSHEKEQTYKTNVAASVAAVTTGLPFMDIQRWGEQFKLALPTRSFLWKVFEWMQPAIEKVSVSHQTPVLEEIKIQYEGRTGVHVTADGAYVKRHNVPITGNIALGDGRSKLILHNEVLLQSRAGSGNLRESENFRRVLEKLSSYVSSVSSLTSNDSPLVGPLQREVEQFAGSIRHYSPGCYLLKWFEDELRKAASYHDCEQIGAWHKRIKNHLWRCIEYGINNGVDAVPIFNTCLMHVRGVHKWPEEKLTGPYTKCYHDPVSRPCHESLMLDGKAFHKFENIVLTESFQRDIANSSPYGDIVVYDLRKALDRFYCRKEIQYPLSMYPFCSLMATMHVNTRTMWETKRRREQIQKRKRHKRLATNSPTRHTWRKSIFDEVLKERLLALEKSQNGDETSEYVRGLIAADEYYERNL